METLARLRGDWEPFANPLGLVRLILLVDWDPIGVFGHPGAMDEYDSYVQEIYDLLVSNASSEEITAHLKQIEVEQMGGTGSRVWELEKVAAKLRQVYDVAHMNQTQRDLFRE